MRALLVTCLAGLALVVSGGAGAQSPTLFATVGPGFQIGLADASGSPVTHLDPGTYTIQVADKASVHNFHLSGPGVDMATGVEEVATVTWTVTFTQGSYHYQCDPHAGSLNGDFTVGNAPPPPTTTTTPTPPPPPAKPLSLRAHVGPGASIGVSRLSGARVRTVKAGAVVLVVADRSARDNFHLIGPGVNRATSRAGKTTVTWRLRLKVGLYTYRSDATPALRGTFRAG